MELAVNMFTGGMVLDSHPLVQSSNTLSDALNATYITMNGNEVVLQNDMGNRRVDNAYLPAGYEPVGIKEYGGVIYIASYNPITNKSQIGSFPSPQKRISSIDGEEGLEMEFDLSSMITTYKKAIYNSGKELNFLKSDFIINSYSDKYPLHIGDKFILYGDNSSLYNYDKKKSWVSNFYNTTVNSETKEEKVDSPKNRLFTIDVGVLNSQNDFVKLTKSLVRWNKKEMLDLSDFSEELKLNSGYFIKDTGSELWETVTNQIFEEARNKIDANTYLYKLSGPLSLKTTINHLQTFTLNIIPEYNKYDEVIFTSADWEFKKKDEEGDGLFIDFNSLLLRDKETSYDSVIFFTPEEIKEYLETNFGFAVEANSTKVIHLLFKIKDKDLITLVLEDGTPYRLQKLDNMENVFSDYTLTLSNPSAKEEEFCFKEIRMYNTSGLLEELEPLNLDKIQNSNYVNEYTVKNYYKDFDIFDLYEENSSSPLKYYNRGVTISYDGTNYTAIIKKVYLKLVENEDKVYNFIALPKLINNNGKPFGESNCLGTEYTPGMSGVLYLNVEAVITYNSPDLLSLENDPVNLGIFYNGIKYERKNTIGITKNILRQEKKKTTSNYFDYSYNIEINDDDPNLIYFSIPNMMFPGSKILIEGLDVVLQLYDLQEESPVDYAPFNIGDNGEIVITQEIYDLFTENIVFKLVSGSLNYVTIPDYFSVYNRSIGTEYLFDGNNIVLQLFDLGIGEFIGNPYTVVNNKLTVTLELLNLVTSNNIVYKLVSGNIYSIREIYPSITENTFSSDYDEVKLYFTEPQLYEKYNLNITFNYLVENDLNEEVPKSIVYSNETGSTNLINVDYEDGNYVATFNREAIEKILNPLLETGEISISCLDFNISCLYQVSAGSSLSSKENKLYSIYTYISEKSRNEYTINVEQFIRNKIVRVKTVNIEDGVEKELINYNFVVYDENGNQLIDAYESNIDFTPNQLDSITKNSYISLYNRNCNLDYVILESRSSGYYLEEPIYLPGFERSFSLNIKKLNSGTIDVSGWRTFTSLGDSKQTTLTATIQAYPKANETYSELYLVLTDPNYENDSNELESALLDKDSTKFNDYITQIEPLINAGCYTKSTSKNPILHIITLSLSDFLLLQLELLLSLEEINNTNASYEDLLKIHPSRLYNADLVWKVTKNDGNTHYKKLDNYWIMTTTLFNGCYTSGDDFIENYVSPTEHELTVRDKLLNFKPNVSIETSTKEGISYDSATVNLEAFFNKDIFNFNTIFLNLEDILIEENHKGTYLLQLSTSINKDIYPSNIISTTTRSSVISSIDEVIFDTTDLNNKIVNRSGEDWGNDCLNNVSEINFNNSGNLSFKFKLCLKYKGIYKPYKIGKSFLPLSKLNPDWVSYDSNFRVKMGLKIKNGKPNLDDRQCQVTFSNLIGEKTFVLSSTQKHTHLYLNGISANDWMGEIKSINFCLDNDSLIEFHGKNWSGHFISTGSNGGTMWDYIGFPTGCIRPGVPPPDLNSYSTPDNKYNPGFFANSSGDVRGVLYDGGWDSRNASFIWVKSEDGQTLYKIGLICKDNPSVCNYLLQNFSNFDKSILSKLRGEMNDTYGVINLNYSESLNPQKIECKVGSFHLDCATFLYMGTSASLILSKIFILILGGLLTISERKRFDAACENYYIQTPLEVSPYIPSFDGRTKYINLENELSTSITVDSQINLNGKFVSNNLGRVNITIINLFNFLSKLKDGIILKTRHYLKDIVESGFKNIIQIWRKENNKQFSEFIYYRNNNLNNPLGSDPIDLWIESFSYSKELHWNTIENNLKIKIDDLKKICLYATAYPDLDPYLIVKGKKYKYTKRISAETSTVLGSDNPKEMMLEDPSDKRIDGYYWGINLNLIKGNTKMVSWIKGTHDENFAEL